MTRQRAWQKKMKAEGKCVICAQPLKTKNHCEMHAKEAKYNAQRYQAKKKT